MNKRLLFIFLIILSILLSGCSSGESDWIEAFVDSWFTVNGLAVEEGFDVDLGKLVNKTIDRAVDGLTNGEESTALDAAEDTIKDIERADAIMDEALAGNDLDKIYEDQRLRPDDINYREAQVAITAADGGSMNARDAIFQADKKTTNFVEQGGDCRSARLNQLTTRREMLIQQLNNPDLKISSDDENYMYDLIENADYEIMVINSGMAGDFCIGIGAGN